MIDVTQDGDLWTVTLNRPDKANALTADMLVQLGDIAIAAKSAKAFILTGTGKVFSAGADLDAVKSGLAVDPAWERLSQAIADIQGLTIAALNGTVAGGAFGMVLACDIRIAVPKTRFFYPVMKIGVMPQPSDPPRMTQLIGPARAKMILLAGQKIDADTALQWGLVDRLADPDALLTDALELTHDSVAAVGPNAYLIKKSVSV
jgi:enoyl-CoA hydratase/carnithine racemase